jgi:hypothetical protein
MRHGLLKKGDINHNALRPPAKIAKFSTDAAARYQRATLSWAVDHVPVALLYKSTILEGDPSAAARVRQSAIVR